MKEGNYYEKRKIDRVERKQQVKTKIPNPEDLFQFVHKSNLSELKKYIGKNFTPDLRNDKGQTLLHYALIYNQLKIARFLISSGADIEKKDYDGNSIKDVILERFPKLKEKKDTNWNSIKDIILEHFPKLMEKDYISSSDDENLSTVGNITDQNLNEASDWCTLL